MPNMIRMALIGLIALRKLPVIANSIVIAGMLNNEKNVAQKPSNRLILKALLMTNIMKIKMAHCFNDIFSYSLMLPPNTSGGDKLP